MDTISSRCAQPEQGDFPRKAGLGGVPGGARGREEQAWGLVMAAGRKQEDSVLIGATFFTYVLTRPLARLALL